MAHAKSTLATNATAVPIVYNKVGLYGARVRSIVTTVESTSGDNDTFALCMLNPEWRVLHIWTTNDANSGGTDYDIGLYSDGAGTVISADATACYSDGVTMASAVTALPRDLAFGGGTKGRAIEKLGQFVYEDAGHTTANKLTEYWLTVTAVDAGTASKTMVFNILFTVD